jgi:hypothetical protein
VERASTAAEGVNSPATISNRSGLSRRSEVAPE